MQPAFRQGLLKVVLVDTNVPLDLFLSS